MKYMDIINIILKSNVHIKKLFSNINAYTLIKKYALFDEDFYLESYPHIKESKMSPLIHYLFHGYKEKKLPSKYFDGNFYLKRYRNVKKSGMNPLVHYVLYGFHESKCINEWDDGFITCLNQNIYTQYKRGIHDKIITELSSNNYVTRPDIIMPYIESDEEYVTGTIKVGVFLYSEFKRMDACSAIRLDIPLKKLSTNKEYHFFIYSKEVYPKFVHENIINYKCFDVLIFQRYLRDLNLVKIFDKCEKYGIKTIYEFDDEFKMDKTHFYYNSISNLKEHLKFLNEKSDILTVSTPILLERYNKRGSTVLIRNYCTPMSLPIKKIKSQGIITIGYLGSRTHVRDLLLIKDAIISLKEKLQNNDILIKFEVIGITNSADNWYDEIKIPNGKGYFNEFMPWLKENAKWDIGVAPLEDTYFNKAKSELKYIEYTALGIPTVCTDIEAYNGVIKDGVNGFLAKNTEEWVEKLEKLVINKNLRKKIHNNALRDISTNYKLEDRVKQWDDLLKL